MEELSVNCLKFWTKAHKKLIHAVKITILGSGSTLGKCQTMRGGHLIALALDVGDLSKESLNRTITLIADAKSLEQGVAQRLTRGQVEMT